MMTVQEIFSLRMTGHIEEAYGYRYPEASHPGRTNRRSAENPSGPRASFDTRRDTRATDGEAVCELQETP